MKKFLRLNFSKNVKRPEFLDKGIKNYNFEQFKDFTKKYKKAVDQKELLLKKLNSNDIEVKKSSNIKYDINSDQTNYYAWRTFSKPNSKGITSVFPRDIMAKVNASPALMKRAFGHPLFKTKDFPHSIGYFAFEDCFLTKFQIFDYQPEVFKNFTKNELDYYNEYYSQNDETEFRIYSSSYPEKLKFMKFIENSLDYYRNNPDESFEKMMIEKAGKAQPRFEYENTYEEKREPTVFKTSRQEFEKLHKSDLTFINDSQFNKKPNPAEFIN